MNTLQVANYFLSLADVDGEEINPMKLVKLVYFAHGWHLSIKDSPLIDESIIARAYGPSIVSIYDEFSYYGNNPIRRRAGTVNQRGEFSELRIPAGPEYEDTRQLLCKVWKVYKVYSALQLATMAHAPGTPWSLTQGRNKAISDDSVKDYYKKQRTL